MLLQFLNFTFDITLDDSLLLLSFLVIGSASLLLAKSSHFISFLQFRALEKLFERSFFVIFVILLLDKLNSHLGLAHSILFLFPSDSIVCYSFHASEHNHVFIL